VAKQVWPGLSFTMWVRHQLSAGSRTETKRRYHLLHSCNKAMLT